MDPLTLFWLASAVLFVVATAGQFTRGTLRQSDRYVMMRLTLMKIARGDYENANALAQTTLDAVNAIDDERVRMYYEAK